MKYLLRLSADRTGTVMDGDTLRRFINASQSEGDEAFGLPELARYVGARLHELLDADTRGDEPLSARLARIEALLAAWCEIPDHAPTVYDQGRVDQRHMAAEELAAALAGDE